MTQGDENMTGWLGRALGPGSWMPAALLLAQAGEAETVLITGAGSELGQEFARQYTADGWTVEVSEMHGDLSAATVANLDSSFGETQLRTNQLGPLCVSESFLRQVGTGQLKRVVSITLAPAPLTRPISGSSAVFYRASKDGLNRAMLVVADEVRPSGITVLLIHPGGVQKLAAESATNHTYGQRMKIDVTVRRMKTMRDVTIRDSGRFLLYDGSTLPW
jgi:NAD(P)-dependent dehydrogenase (short-subunit alcohol dehydrogenase family)